MGATFLLRVFVPFALGYFLSYVLRTVNAIIAPQLTSEMALNAANLGLLTSAYFLSFAAMQIPLGIWLDKYPPRRVEAALLLIAASGAALFAMAADVVTLAFARALIGVGVCCCLMASFRTFALWVPKERIPLMNGIQLAVGSIGAIVTTAPAQKLLPFLGWRGLFWVIVVLLIFAAMWLAFATPDPKPRNVESSGDLPPKSAVSAPQVSSASAWSSPIFWTLAPFASLNTAHGMSMQSLWASPWLTHVAGVPLAALGAVLVYVSIGMLIGNLLSGWLATHFAKRGVPAHMVAATLAVIALVAQVPLILGISSSPALVFFAFGLFNCTGNIVFSSVNHFFPPQVLGRVLTALNLTMFALVFVLQWATGAIVNLYPKTGGGYEAKGFFVAFSVIAVLQVLSLIWFFMRRHTLVKSD